MRSRLYLSGKEANLIEECEEGSVQNVGDYEADVELVWSNAMAFNEDGSQVYEDAKILKSTTS